MATERDRSHPQSPPVHRSSSAADKRTVRRLGARIFADLLPESTRDPAPGPSTSRLDSSVADAERSRSSGDTRPVDSVAADPQTPATPVGKETSTMRAYRTESRYYFSSRQLLPAGSLVFFSAKIYRRALATGHSADLLLRRTRNTAIFVE
jgi:hypothetical protein